MNSQTLCLGVLSHQEASGYDIRQYFEEALSTFQQTSFGSIYPALAKLEEQGWVTSRVEPQDKRPDKTMYRITQAGQDELQRQLLSTEPSEHYRSDFLALLGFAHVIDTPSLQRIVETQIHNIENEMAALHEIEKKNAETLSAAQRFSLHYGLTIKASKLTYLRQHLNQLLQDHAQENPS